MVEKFARLRGGATAKVAFIGLLVLALLIPLGMVERLIRERGALAQTAEAEIGRTWGGPQTVGGPLLAVPYRFTQMAYGAERTVTDTLYVLPSSLSFRASAQTERLRRGIYRVPAYIATIEVSGELPAAPVDASLQDLEVLWDRAYFSLPLTDPRAVREPVELAIGGATAPFRLGAPGALGFGSELTVPYAAFGLERFDTAQAFSFTLVLGGTRALHFLPLGDSTDAELRADWSSPSFVGAALPVRREVTDAGFTASWRMPNFGRGYPGHWARSAGTAVQLASSAFGVDLLEPLGVHDTSLRAVRYGVLTIGLTFACYFLFELLARVRLHALQYLLVGGGCSVFYVLLLALAEHWGFGVAYFASAAASTLLITAYSGAVLGAARRALPVLALLTALHVFLYVTLSAEDYALLFGAIGLFAMLAVLMYATRRIDWHAVRFDETLVRGARAPGAPHGSLG